MDYNAKMVELEALWQDSFDLCQSMIRACKAGEQKLTGSILKELNAFIKQSMEFLKYRESEAVRKAQAEEEEKAMMEGLKDQEFNKDEDEEVVEDQDLLLELPEFDD
jgi:hypothetical protein